MSMCQPCRMQICSAFLFVFNAGTSILLPKLFWPTVRKNCFSDREKLLKFEAEGQEFAKFLRSLEQFIQTSKGLYNFCPLSHLLSCCVICLFLSFCHILQFFLTNFVFYFFYNIWDFQNPEKRSFLSFNVKGLTISIVPFFSNCTCNCQFSIPYARHYKPRLVFLLPNFHFGCGL